MNKKFENYFNSIGLKAVSLNAYGYLRDYEVNGINWPKNKVAPFVFHISFYLDIVKKNELAEDLKSLTNKYVHFDMTNFGMCIGLNASTQKELLDKMDEYLNRFMDKIDFYEPLKSEYCPFCGSELRKEDGYIQYDGFKIKLDTQCRQKFIQYVIEENVDLKENSNQPDKFGLGLLGALFGGLFGIAISIVLPIMGIVSSLSSFLAMYLGQFFYQKFGGKATKKMIVTVTIVSIFSIVIGFILSYYVETLLAFEENFTFAQFLFAFYMMMGDSEFASSVYKDIAFNALFALLGIVIEIIYLRKKIKDKNETEILPIENK